MTTQTKWIQVTLETELDSVDLAEDITMRVADAAGFDEDDCHKIGMAVREGAINAFQHGNRMQRGKRIFLTLGLGPEQLLILLRDQGAGFELEKVCDPCAEENLLKTSGRGIFLIRSFMDGLEVRRGHEGGAEVVMTKRFPASNSSGARPARERKEG